MRDDIAQAEEIKDDCEAHAKHVAQLEDVVAKFKAARRAHVLYEPGTLCDCKLCEAIRALDAIE